MGPLADEVLNYIENVMLIVDFQDGGTHTSPRKNWKETRPKLGALRPSLKRPLVLRFLISN